jgi:hypothetical protein
MNPFQGEAGSARRRRLLTNVGVLIALVVAGRLTRGQDETTRIIGAAAAVVLVFALSAFWPRSVA